jgi:hypothetical protein
MKNTEPRGREADQATMDVPTAGRILGIGRGLAYELARQGKLPGVLRLGARYIVSRKLLERFLDGESGRDKQQKEDSNR